MLMLTDVSVICEVKRTFPSSKPILGSEQLVRVLRPSLHVIELGKDIACVEYTFSIQKEPGFKPHTPTFVSGSHTLFSQ